MYTKCGALEQANEVFDELQVRDIIIWNALIAGYVDSGYLHEALGCFELLQHEGLSANAVTFTCIFKACGKLGVMDKVKRLCDEVYANELLLENVYIATAMVDMYAKCGALDKAQEVFDKIKAPNTASWNALISGYAQNGHGEEALDCYEQMQYKSVSVDTITLVCVLTACGSIRAADKGKEMHDEILRMGLLGKNVRVDTSLLDMYAKCGALGKAQEVFDKLDTHNIVTWNALIAGYTQNGYGKEALDYFEQMQHQCVYPEVVTILCILKACGTIGAARKGKELHASIVEESLIRNVYVGTALLDMYARCGELELAQSVFDDFQVRTVLAWTALIHGYAQHGYGEKALDCASKMQLDGLSFDFVTWTVVLNACSHSGLLENGLMFFEAMSCSFGVVPSAKHYSCLVDLYCRSGHLHKAVEVVKKVSTSDLVPVWTAFLGACQKLGNVELGRLAFEHALQLDVSDTGAYICIRNIYLNAGMQRESDEIKRFKNAVVDMSGFC